MDQGFTISVEYELNLTFGGDDMKKKPQSVIETDSLNEPERHTEIPAGEYTIHMALAEATEKYRNSIRPIDRWTMVVLLKRF
jgi:hypothetical protein